MSKKVKIIVLIVVGLLIILWISLGVNAFITNIPKNVYIKWKKIAKNLKLYVDNHFDNEMKFQEKHKDISFFKFLWITCEYF